MSSNYLINAGTKWLLTNTQQEKSQLYTFPTKGTYLDKDILLTVNAKSGSIDRTKLTATSRTATISEGWVEATTISIDIPNTVIEKTELDYNESVVVNAGIVMENTTIKNKTTAGTVVGSAGPIAASVGGLNSNNKYPIEGEATVSLDITAGYISDTVGTKEGRTVLVQGEIDPSTLSATEVTPGAEQTVSIGAGYYPDERTITVRAVSEGEHAVIGTSEEDPGLGYEENITAIVPADGWLKIDSGYMPATKISLATLIPDHEGHTGAGDVNILSGYVAYDKYGSLVVGTMPIGAIVNNTSGGESTDIINRGKQIKITKGYYDADLFYTAQDNDGNVKITQKTGQSVDGYKTASVQEGSATLSAQSITVSGEVGEKDQDNKYPVNMSGSTAVSATVNTGWISEIAGIDVSASGTVLLDESEITDSLAEASAIEVARGAYKKIGAGYYPTARYIKGQANAGVVDITAQNQSVDGYASAKVQDAVAALHSESATNTIITDIEIGTIDNGAYPITATGKMNVFATITQNGWLDNGDIQPIEVSSKGEDFTIPAAGLPTVSLMPTTDIENYPSGYETYRMVSHLGYNHEDKNAGIDVYQGGFSITY